MTCIRSYHKPASIDKSLFLCSKHDKHLLENWVCVHRISLSNQNSHRTRIYPKGSIVHVNVWAIARDPAAWKNPLEFRPERFLEEDVDIKGHDYRLLPFGAGRRICPGAQLALNLVTSMLGHLLHHFTWSPPPGVRPEEIDLEESPGTVTYMRTPLQAVATPRLPAHLYNRVPVEL